MDYQSVQFMHDINAVTAALFFAGVVLLAIFFMTLVSGEFTFRRAARCLIYASFGAIYIVLGVFIKIIVFVTKTTSPIIIFSAIVSLCALSAAVCAVFITWALTTESANKESIPAAENN